MTFHFFMKFSTYFFMTFFKKQSEFSLFTRKKLQLHLISQKMDFRRNTSLYCSIENFPCHYLHLYLVAFGVLEQQLYPGFPVVRGAFKLRELISPQYGLRGMERIRKRCGRDFNNEHNI